MFVRLLMPERPEAVLSQNLENSGCGIKQEDLPLPLAAVFSVEGETLSRAEKTLFAASQPFGFILFGRNCVNPQQVRALVDDLRATLGWHCPVMIDQEGGRVARLKSPHWDVMPSARYYGEMIEADDDTGSKRLRQDMLHLCRSLVDLGIDVNCAPVMDLLLPETHQVIGDRAYSADPVLVAQAADVVCQAFLDSGVTPVIKHMPGHGRGTVDSHLDLPVVETSAALLEKSDFLPFSLISKKSYAASLWGMIGHVVYTAYDSERPASLSPVIIQDVIRKQIGFDGLLFSDDLDMKALDKFGSVEQRAQESLQAGCDLALYCHGHLKIMERLAAHLPPLSAAGWRRWQASRLSAYAAA